MASEDERLQEKIAEIGMQIYKDYMIKTIDLLNRMEEAFGADVSKVIDQMVADRTLEQWAEIAKSETSHTMQDLMRLLWEPLRSRGFEFTIEEKDEGIQIYCTKCAFYDLAQEIDGAKWMYHLNCGTDPHIVAGFNPEIGYRRTKTLMQGDDCCDHFYHDQ